jgi:hypothetical protein
MMKEQIVYCEIFWRYYSSTGSVSMKKLSGDQVLFRDEEETEFCASGESDIGQVFGDFDE